MSTTATSTTELAAGRAGKTGASHSENLARARAKAKTHQPSHAKAGKQEVKHKKHKKHRKKLKKKPVPHPVAPIAGLPGAPAPPAIPVNPPLRSSTPPEAQGAPLTLAQATRLLWRAGFGPTPGQAEALAGQPIEEVVHGLTRPVGAAVLTGPEPTDDEGDALEPADAWGQDHCWWMDRMIRSDQQLVERMTFIWHDWFANSNEKVDDQQRMLDQNDLMRERALGSFHDLFLAITANPAMLVFLDGIYNDKYEPNENYAREMMELFSLGADRGAYTETDVREMARTLTGWTAEWTESSGLQNFRFDPSRHDYTPKTVFGQTGNWNWEDAVRLCVTHPLHASFFVSKLWGYFVGEPPSEATLASLQGLYIGSQYSIRAVVEAILQHPDFLEGPELVTPPVVYNVGLLRAIGRPIDTTAWSWLCSSAGQQLSTRRTSRAGISPLAGHIDREGQVGNRQLCDRQDLLQSVALRRPGEVQRHGDSRGSDGGRHGLLGAPFDLQRIRAVHRTVRRLMPRRRRNGRLAAESLPGDQAERAADAHRHLPRHAGELT